MSERRLYRQGDRFTVAWVRVALGLVVALLVAALVAVLLGAPWRLPAGLAGLAVVPAVAALMGLLDDGTPPDQSVTDVSTNL
ncbi:hypothetical protein RDV89_15930 [Nocardioides zeae]|uniref:DUF202 domain-containing protein n=1 Tax=Nocardioides imazamoxiresistens TaxID=3231893 RepID=A0ABU3PZL8_9ACTN|nr:hypothetical protein [Nocardioides zeae]MDT9594574.1 hypothetical protein [Nocardioides zeae]